MHTSFHERGEEEVVVDGEWVRVTQQLNGLTIFCDTPGFATRLAAAFTELATRLAAKQSKEEHNDPRRTSSTPA